MGAPDEINKQDCDIEDIDRDEKLIHEQNFEMMTRGLSGIQRQLQNKNILQQNKEPKTTL